MTTDRRVIITVLEGVVNIIPRKQLDGLCLTHLQSSPDHVESPCVDQIRTCIPVIISVFVFGVGVSLVIDVDIVLKVTRVLLTSILVSGTI